MAGKFEMRATDATSGIDPQHFMSADRYVEADHPSVTALGRRLRAKYGTDVEFARAAFEWVRDAIAHSYDAGDPRVTLAASDVLREGVGLCYAKSVLLAAILRNEQVPAALMYQRLGDAEQGYYLHGVVAVHLEGAWHRQDPRGNRPGIDAHFSVAAERLAYVVEPGAGQIDYPYLYETVAQEVVDALAGATSILECALPTDLRRSAPIA